MNVLITGINGFVGSAVARLLLAENCAVTGMVRKKDQCKDDGISYVVQDFTKPFITRELPLDIECIIHLGATMDKTVDNRTMFQINHESTIDLLEYGKAIGIKRFVFASSGGVYGYSEKTISERMTPHPTDFYGLTKYLSEGSVNHYSRYFSTVNLRLFFPYGVGQTKGIIPTLTRMIRNKQGILIYNTMNPKMNPIHISDVARAIARSCTLNGNNTMNICGDEVTSVYDLSCLISEMVGVPPKFVCVTDKGITDLVASNWRMKRYLGVTPTVTLQQGIKEFLSSK
jgi:UDP-glucose 4-epimerase